MNENRKIKSLTLGIVIGFLFSTSGCMTTDVEASKNAKTVAIQLFQKSEDSNSQIEAADTKYEFVEDWMEETLKQETYRNKNVIQSLLEQKGRFRAMAEACLNIKGSTDGKFAIRGLISEPMRLSEKHYLIDLACAVYSTGNDFRLFSYTTSKGLDTTPLKLEVPDVDGFGHISIKTTKELIGRSGYNEQRKELSIKVACNYSAGRLTSITKYKFENDKFLLKEFWLDNLNNKKCISKPNLKRLYP